jgi:8-oxo-dGTP diphosphatase/2-hydroxy-dATP diphosphatase
MLEESGLEAIDLKKIGYLEFQFEPDLSQMLECHVFETSTFSGHLTECDEISPKWFNIVDIPYELMWSDDRLWFPRMLANRLFKAHFLFAHDQKTILKYSIDTVNEF